MNSEGDAYLLLEFRSYNNNARPISLNKDYARKRKGKNIWAAALAN